MPACSDVSDLQFWTCLSMSFSLIFVYVMAWLGVWYIPKSHSYNQAVTCYTIPWPQSYSSIHVNFIKQKHVYRDESKLSHDESGLQKWLAIEVVVKITSYCPCSFLLWSFNPELLPFILWSLFCLCYALWQLHKCWRMACFYLQGPQFFFFAA